MLVVTSAYVHADSGGGVGKSQGNPTGGGECLFFLAGNRAVLLGNLVFLGGKSHDHGRF